MNIRYPFIKITVLFTLGILIQKWILLPFIILPIGLTVTFLLFYFSGKQGKYLLNYFEENFISLVKSFLLYFIIILCGYYIAEIKYAGYSFLPEKLDREKDIVLYGEVNSVSLENAKGFTFEVKSDSFSFAGKTYHVPSNVICNVRRENLQEGFYPVYNSLYSGGYVKVKGYYTRGREARNPGEFDYNNFLKNKGISGVITALNKDDITILSYSSGAGIWKFFENSRRAFARKINSLQDVETAPLLKGLILADRSDIDEDVKNDFINSGVVHVLAVSGLHVAFIVLIIIMLCGRAGLWVRFFVITAGIIFYVLLTGAPASVVRAGIMSILILAAFVYNRDTGLLNTIAVSAFIILLISPQELFNAGFLLSYAAVLSIALLYPILINIPFIKDIKNKKIKKFILFVLLSFSAQIGTLPFILIYFGKISLTSLFSNMAAIPLSGVILGNGLFTILLSYIYTPLAQLSAFTNILLVKVLYLFTHLFGGGDYSFVQITNFRWSAFIVFYLMIAAFMYWFPKFMTWKSRLALTALIIANIIIFYNAENNNFFSNNELGLLALDVGQGDSFIIHFPDGNYGLLDAGEATMKYDNGEKVVLPVMNYLRIPYIDYAFISHMDKDHYSGIISLIHNGKIKKVFKPAPEPNDSLSIKFERYCSKSNIPVEYYKKNKLNVGGARVYMLNDKQFSNNNDNSGIIKIKYGKTSFLFTGDASSKSEKHYLEYESFLKSDVLKVSHHGSKNASSITFLSKVKPSYAIISAGLKNRYGHPAPEVITRLNTFHANILRTDYSGAFLLNSDGEHVSNVQWR